MVIGTAAKSMTWDRNKIIFRIKLLVIAGA